MSYKLTLTKGDRDAIDWIGNRYSGAPALYSACMGETEWAVDSFDDPQWDSPCDITFTFPEHLAWIIQSAVDEDMDGGHSAWPCFAPELRDKLNAFLDSIV